MTGKVTIRHSSFFLTRKRWWWPFGDKKVCTVMLVGEVQGPDGAHGEFAITLSACDAFRTAIGEYEIVGAAASGNVQWTKRDHHKHEV
jgi:hypothetical protein